VRVGDNPPALFFVAKIKPPARVTGGFTKEEEKT
jgi:hypothetical protein